MFSIRKIHIMVITTIIFLISLISCTSQKNTLSDGGSNMNYSILTKMEILYNEEVANNATIFGQEIGLILKLTYLSDIPFELEIGLLDNYSQRSFEIKNNDKFLTDNIFKMYLSNSNGKYVECKYELRIDNLKYNYHDLIFFIKNPTKIQRNSLRAYNFLRFEIKTDSNTNYDLNKISRMPFTPHDDSDSVFEIEPHPLKNETQLQFNIKKLYEGDKLIDEYNSHSNSPLDFVVVTLSDNAITKYANNESYIWSNTFIGKSGYINLPNIFTDYNDLVFILIPYPFLRDYNNFERYQKIAYNNICYYQYTK